MKNIKIKTKLLVSFLAIAIIAGIISAIGISQLIKLKNADKLMYEDAVLGLSSTTQMESAWGRVKTLNRDYLIAKTPESKAEALKDLTKDYEYLKKTILDYESTVHVEEDRNNFNALKDDFAKYCAESEKYHKLIADNKQDEAFQSLYEGDMFKAKNLIAEAIAKVAEFNLRNGKEIYDTNDKTASFGVTLTIVFALIGFIFAIVMGLIIANSISSKLDKSVAIANSIADGDLTIQVQNDSKDEIGQLMDAQGKMVAKLQEVISLVVTNADNIAAASSQMSSNSQQVSQGATEQASSAEEISSSIEEMASNIQQNTDNSQQTEKISASAASGIKESNAAVAQTVESMRQIASKVTIISDIAFQTNILALNAAVEAARAGEHGKGFAVVAAEVRKLAERSQIAAGEINTLTKNSVEIADKSGKMLTAIVPDIERTAKLVQEITAASLEQNSGADQINNAISQLNQVTQENAAAAEEMATSSEELAGQADELKQAISFFNIGNHSVKRNAPSIKQAVKQFGQPNRKPAALSPKPTNKNSGGFNLDMGGSKDDAYERF